MRNTPKKNSLINLISIDRQEYLYLCMLYNMHIQCFHLLVVAYDSNSSRSGTLLLVDLIFTNMDDILIILV